MTFATTHDELGPSTLKAIYTKDLPLLVSSCWTHVHITYCNKNVPEFSSTYYKMQQLWQIMLNSHSPWGWNSFLTVLQPVLPCKHALGKHCWQSLWSWICHVPLVHTQESADAWHFYGSIERLLGSFWWIHFHLKRQRNRIYLVNYIKYFIGRNVYFHKILKILKTEIKVQGLCTIANECV